MKSVLITGATSGLGKKLSETLVKNFQVFCLGRNKKELAYLEKIGCKTLCIDFLLEEKNWIKKINDFCNNTDILINNAGIFPIKNITNSSIKDYENCFKINVKTPYLLMKNSIFYLYKKSQKHSI